MAENAPRRRIWRRLGRALVLAVLIPGWAVCALGLISAVGPSFLLTVGGWREPSPVPSAWSFGSRGPGGRRSCSIRIASGAVNVTATGKWRALPDDIMQDWPDKSGTVARGVLAGVHRAHGVDSEGPSTRSWASIGVGIWVPFAMFVGVPLAALVIGRRRSVRSAVAPSPSLPGQAFACLSMAALSTSLAAAGALAIGSVAGAAGLNGDAALTVYEDWVARYEGWVVPPTFDPPRQLRLGEHVALQAHAASGGGALELGSSSAAYAPSIQSFALIESWDPEFGYPSFFAGRFLDRPSYGHTRVDQMSPFLTNSYRVDFGGWLPCVLLVPLAGLRVWLWLRGPHRRRYRLRHNLCLTCGYNLTGNVSGRCSECGTPVPATAARIAAGALVGGATNSAASVPHP